MYEHRQYSTTSMHKSLLTARVLPYLHSNGCRPGVLPKNVNGCSLIHLTKLSPVYEPVQWEINSNLSAASDWMPEWQKHRGKIQHYWQVHWWLNQSKWVLVIIIYVCVGYVLGPWETINTHVQNGVSQLHGHPHTSSWHMNSQWSQLHSFFIKHG